MRGLALSIASSQSNASATGSHLAPLTLQAPRSNKYGKVQSVHSPRLTLLGTYKTSFTSLIRDANEKAWDFWSQHGKAGKLGVGKRWRVNIA